MYYYLGYSISSDLTYYSEESVYMKLFDETKQNYAYWKQQCEGFIFMCLMIIIRR